MWERIAGYTEKDSAGNLVEISMWRGKNAEGDVVYYATCDRDGIPVEPGNNEGFMTSAYAKLHLRDMLSA